MPMLVVEFSSDFLRGCTKKALMSISLISRKQRRQAVFDAAVTSWLFLRAAGLTTCSSVEGAVLEKVGCLVMGSKCCKVRMWTSRGRGPKFGGL